MARKRQLALRLAGCLAGLGMVVSACGALNPDDPAATLQSQRQGFVDEATSIAQAAEAQSTQVVSTVAAAQTYVALLEGRNRQLVATLQIAFPPTAAIVNNEGPGTPGQMATPAPLGAFEEATPAASSGDTANSGASLGDMQFTQVGTASGVRDSDGCASELTNSFASDVQRIYITARALNIQSGTEMRVEWYYEGQMTYTESFVVDNDDNDFCLWFFLAPTDVALSTGNWSVRLLANNQTIEPQVDFTVG